MTEPRSNDQILVDALEAEKVRLSRRLEKLKAIRAADPLGDLLALHAEAAGLDFKTKEGLAKLDSLAQRERVARAALDKQSKRDTFKDMDEQTTLEIEIGAINSEIFFKKKFGRCK
jgi:hypothetical protein